ncbi:hypothetical protein C8A03DRAFT_17965 [Achaetomium macrosporum]|uniref:Uncharacterized protein n=1 Tax=Achaetomium macrosporum TaxID=79813 RepID=A0AAN7HBV0_9PEZI|nr:hypothetical protein C8A03DRAFT_17965 [Achaetomium macrosporum]
MALMERLAEAPPTPYWLRRFGRVGSWLTWWRFLSRSVGLPGTHKAAVVAKLVAALKAESGPALQGRIDAVSVTAPWVAAWENDIPVDGVVNDALVVAGLTPYTWEASGPIYLSETSAVLAANGRRLCRERWCGIDIEDESDMWPQIAYFISFSNHSLYTSFQAARCFYRHSWQSYLGSINTKYGLDRLDEATTSEQFWNALRDHLLSSVVEFTKRHRDDYSHSDFIILTAGEAAHLPELLDTIRRVAKSIPQLRVDQGAARLPKVELVISDDPTFSAARGAALWLRMMMDWSYSDGFEDDTVSQYDVTRDGHSEL